MATTDGLSKVRLVTGQYREHSYGCECGHKDCRETERMSHFRYRERTNKSRYSDLKLANRFVAKTCPYRNDVLASL